MHIAGSVQTFGAIVAVDLRNQLITHACTGASQLLNRPIDMILGADPRDLLGRRIMHDVHNATSRSDHSARRVYLGRYDIEGTDHVLHSTAAPDGAIVEFEPAVSTPALAADFVDELSSLVTRIQDAKTLDELFATTVKLLRFTTGYDRVMVYRFDPDYNGEVIAEACAPALDPLVGLRFPHWDIPPQARDIMRKVTTRIIADTAASPNDLVADRPDRAPLDMTQVLARGVSPIHMQYLRNMGVGGSMTLSLVIDGRLWGMIAMHRAQPAMPTLHVRQLCDAFIPLMVTKIEVLQQTRLLSLAKDLEKLQHDLREDLDQSNKIAPTFFKMSDRLCTGFYAQGIALVEEDEVHTYGSVPELAFFETLATKIADEAQGVVHHDDLPQTFPDASALLGSIAGVMAITLDARRALFVFRESRDHDVQWAGAPDKDIEVVSGNLRLMPRGSFEVYKQTIRGKSVPWSAAQVDLAGNIWRLLLASTRASMIAELQQSRLQGLMNDELNHRVRNILALVGAVSRRARDENVSIDAYKASVETRIRALAAAHEIGMGQSDEPVPIRRILQLEAAPHATGSAISVEDASAHWNISPEMAAVFALVIHEAMTNAAKYGALSVPEGRLHITLQDADDGLHLDWVETGGPSVASPQRQGFGTGLITHAVGYEMAGRSTLHYDPGGVRIEIVLPYTILSPEPAAPQTDATVEAPEGADAFPAALLDLRVLVLEDVYVVAADMQFALQDIGFTHVDICSTSASAEDVLDQSTVGLAILDINLGGQTTSFDFARRLKLAGIPFVFVTGYKGCDRMPADLHDNPVLIKPVGQDALATAVRALLC